MAVRYNCICLPWCHSVIFTLDFQPVKCQNCTLGSQDIYRFVFYQVYTVNILLYYFNVYVNKKRIVLPFCGFQCKHWRSDFSVNQYLLKSVSTQPYSEYRIITSYLVV